MNPATLTGLRVLLVEDELLVAMVAESMLTDAGCEVVGPVGKLGRAVKLAELEEIDVAVLDVNLGHDDVFPVADTLSERGIPFAFVTGYGAAGLPPRFSGHPVLTKPYRTDALLAILEQLRTTDASR